MVAAVLVALTVSVFLRSKAPPEALRLLHRRLIAVNILCEPKDCSKTFWKKPCSNPDDRSSASRCRSWAP